MCLSNVELTVHSEPLTETRLGYKVLRVSFDRHNNEALLAGCMYTTVDSKHWNNDKNNSVLCAEDDLSFNPKTYPAGYHIFKHQQDAKAYALRHERIYRVEYTNIVATGFQSVFAQRAFAAVDVARSFRIIERVS